MDIRLPRLGEGADSGTVATIFVKVGERIRKDQPILELESEKAVATIPAPEGGTVVKIYIKEGDTLKVGQPILALAANGSQPAAPAPADTAPVREPREVEPEPAAPQLPLEDRDTGQPEAAASPFPPPAAPSIRKLARELGLDLRRIRGSERGGRIVMADLRRYVERLQQLAEARPAAVAAPAPAAAVPGVDFAKWGPVRREKLSVLRKTIGARMAAAWTSVARVTQFDQADITDLLAFKARHAQAFEAHGAHLTLTAFLLKAIAPVLRRHPAVNASLDEASGEMVYKQYFHIGIAVDTEQGLIVPVLRDADQQSLLQLALALDALAEKARRRQLSLEELQGASFTISNQGGIGSGHFTPIVNTPEVAILGVGRGRPQPVYQGDALLRRVLLPLTLSYDHRAIDGAGAARFMVDLVAALEQFPESELTSGM